MADLAGALREEIRRLARKETKAQVDTLKKSVTQHRHDIADLKRQLRDQEKKIGFLEARERQRLGEPSTDNGEVAQGSRFSARSVKSQRQRLGLSAKDYSRLLGVSALTVYNWENGKTRPQKAQLAALVGLRGINKREASARLKLLANGGQ
jgi:DNA-binding transcriptional regulator YiaG